MFLFTSYIINTSLAKYVAHPIGSDEAKRISQVCSSSFKEKDVSYGTTHSFIIKKLIRSTKDPLHLIWKIPVLSSQVCIHSLII